MGKAECFRQFRWGYEMLAGFWPKKDWEKYPGESELFPGYFSQSFPGCFASGMAALSAGSIVASPHSGHCSFRLISPPMKFPPQAVIGGSSGPEVITSPSQLSFQSTACVRFLVLSRYFRLCGSRGIIPLVRSGLKAQRNPFVSLSIATFTLHKNPVHLFE